MELIQVYKTWSLDNYNSLSCNNMVNTSVNLKVIKVLLPINRLVLPLLLRTTQLLLVHIKTLHFLTLQLATLTNQLESSLMVQLVVQLTDRQEQAITSALC